MFCLFVSSSGRRGHPNPGSCLRRAKAPPDGIPGFVLGALPFPGGAGGERTGGVGRSRGRGRWAAEVVSGPIGGSGGMGTTVEDVSGGAGLWALCPIERLRWSSGVKFH